MFRPVVYTRVSEGAVDQIVSLIQSRRLEPGDQLPSERQLVEELGISRASVREALRILEGMGLIEVRAGIGAFVKHPVAEALEGGLPSQLLLDRETLEKVFELRRIIESGAAVVAARKATPGNLEKIREAMERVEASHAKQDLDGMVHADIEFHREILVATGNDILVRVMDNIADLLKEMRRSTLSVGDGVRRTIAGHRNIFAALERQQPEEAGEAMQTHLQSVLDKTDRVEVTSDGIVIHRMDDGRQTTDDG